MARGGYTEEYKYGPPPVNVNNTSTYWHNSEREFLPDNAGLQDDQQEFQSAEAEKNRQLELQLAQMPLDWQKEKYNRATGSGLYQSLTGAFTPSTVGGVNSPMSPISQGSIWSDQQIDQQVNQSKSNNQQMAATQNQQISNRAAGQGFASKSPLVAALQGQTNAATMANNAKSEQDIRWNAAEGNSRHLLDTQKAAQQQWADWNDADIRRRQAAYQGQASLLAALGAFS